MSFQAYLDTAEEKTGKTPQELVDLAHAQGTSPTDHASCHRPSVISSRPASSLASRQAWMRTGVRRM